MENIIFTSLIPGEIYKAHTMNGYDWLIKFTPNKHLDGSGVIRHHYGPTIGEKGEKPIKMGLFDFTNKAFWTFFLATEEERRRMGEEIINYQIY